MEKVKDFSLSYQFSLVVALKALGNIKVTSLLTIQTVEM